MNYDEQLGYPSPARYSTHEMNVQTVSTRLCWGRYQKVQKQGYHYADEDAHDLPPTDENDDQGLRSTLGTPYVEFYTSEEKTDEILQEHQTTGKGNEATTLDLR